jgi:membrane associated rhomboid family serine protease
MIRLLMTATNLPMSDQLRRVSRAALSHAKLIATIVVSLWLLEAIDAALLNQGLNQYGIHPRDVNRLPGILFAPLLHLNFAHLSANTLPLAVLAGLILARSRTEFALVTAIVWLVSGLGVWLVAPSATVHIGASGVIFGYLGFLLLRGVFDRTAVSILLALAVGVAYGSILLGVLPTSESISWQGHLFGFISGGIAARMLTGK